MASTIAIASCVIAVATCVRTNPKPKRRGAVLRTAPRLLGLCPSTDDAIGHKHKS